MLTSLQINTIINTLKPYAPKSIGVFGSAARGEDLESSDIDILYNFENGITLFQLAKMQYELEERLNRKVDLISASYISPYLEEGINRDLKVIYEA
ncbi:hypothetical protein SAMN05443429_103134 [Cruoricaptor ignavus]|uniref:Nucleotidyltransferase family protein n=1 Tax=Cruoricaptor ignavus TaxID=1118202 RepID=A0A1M6D6B4_9FLAO|nr:nucleotidyltransferase family protein [Cruoricaptor ignavus]QOR73549.1 nucleotidyltransferase family protein [Cruoricaptor ignavus]SHI68776.1 hypothetical protein SAMN05443429_103134 [Cruoricaptor ignavus]